MGYNVCSKDHNGTKWQAGQKAQGCVSLTLNSTKKLCQSLYLHCLRPHSCCSLTCTPLTSSRNQAWAFVSVLCRVLYYAMMESQNWFLRDAKSEGTRKIDICLLLAFYGLVYFLFWRSQHFGLDFTKIQSQALLYRMLTLQSYFPLTSVPLNNCAIAIIGTLRAPLRLSCASMEA